MPLASGTRLGPYEVLSSLGVGGMGEVYRARDTRLGRDVAVKILPPGVADNAVALARFQREARAVAALSHPNILTIYDCGQATAAGQTLAFSVMELLEGETLRERLVTGALPLRKALEIAALIAHGLAAAHDKQIAHRDLKPENIFITTSGAVKILDFGLARQSGTPSSTMTPPDSPTLLPGTEPGVVLGTVGYMSPEQVRGEPSDHHADTFGLGCVLYEMLTGHRAYQRDTPPETMTAILKEDPPDPAASGVAVPIAVQRIIRRCLEKRPEERFQSTRDLAFALESALDSTTGSGHDAFSVVRQTRWRAVLPMIALGLVVGAGLAALAARRWQTALPIAPPSFKRLTFDRGTIRDARFTPDGQSVIYSAAWEGNPTRVFMTRTDSPESVPLSLPDARLLSISRSGEMAVSLHHTFEGWMGAGTLARSSVLGSAPRVLQESIREAEWCCDGALAVVRRADGLEQLEFPMGHVVYRTSGWVSDIRLSPDGTRIAFADHPLFADDAGGVSVVDRGGNRKALTSGFIQLRGVAWAPNGGEVWFTGTRAGRTDLRDAIFAVSLNGTLRVVWPGPDFVKLYDLAPDGRLLVGTEMNDRRVEALFNGATGPVDVSLRAASVSLWMSDDGSSIVLADQATENYSAYLMKAGKPAVRLGDGQPFGISQDTRWAVTLPVSGAPVMLHPTGAGASRELPNPQKLVFDIVAWLPDGRRVVMFGQQPGQRTRGYVQDVDEGAPRPFTKDNVGVSPLRWWKLPVSPDGSRVIARNDQGSATILHLDTGAAEPIDGLRPTDLPVQWLDDERSILVAHGDGLPWIVERMDLVTGRRAPAFEVRARDAAGLRLSALAVARDGRHWVHSYSRVLNDLYIVDGLR